MYYPSRQALLEALRGQLAKQMMAEPRALLADAALSWTARLDGLAAAWLRFDAEHMPLFHALFHEGGGTTRPDAGLEPCLAATRAPEESREAGCLEGHGPRPLRRRSGQASRRAMRSSGTRVPISF